MAETRVDLVMEREIGDPVVVRIEGFAIAFAGGFLLLSAEATTYVANAGFNVKLGVATPLALAWHVVVQQKARTWTGSAQASAIGKWSGVMELLLWLSVVIASVWFLLTNAVTHPPG